MIVSTSRTMHLQSPPLTIGGTVLKESVDFDILIVMENHLRLFPEQLPNGLVS